MVSRKLSVSISYCKCYTWRNSDCSNPHLKKFKTSLSPIFFCNQWIPIWEARSIENSNSVAFTCKILFHISVDSSRSPSSEQNLGFPWVLLEVHIVAALVNTTHGFWALVFDSKELMASRTWARLWTGLHCHGTTKWPRKMSEANQAFLRVNLQGKLCQVSPPSKCITPWTGRKRLWQRLRDLRTRITGKG